MVSGGVCSLVDGENTAIFVGVRMGYVTDLETCFIDPPPLSPPIFNQISCSGMRPECQVSLFSLSMKRQTLAEFFYSLHVCVMWVPLFVL